MTVGTRETGFRERERGFCAGRVAGGFIEPSALNGDRHRFRIAAIRSVEPLSAAGSGYPPRGSGYPRRIETIFRWEAAIHR